MDKNVKILGLVIVCLFLVFLISGGITGSAFFGLFKSKTQIAEPTSTYSIPPSKRISGCIELTDEQCSAVCGVGVVFSAGCPKPCEHETQPLECEHCLRNVEYINPKDSETLAIAAADCASRCSGTVSIAHCVRTGGCLQ